MLIPFVIFLMIKLLTFTRKKEAAEPAPPPAPSPTEVLLTEIRDVLKSRPA